MKTVFGMKLKQLYREVDILLSIYFSFAEFICARRVGSDASIETIETLRECANAMELDKLSVLSKGSWSGVTIIEHYTHYTQHRQYKLMIMY